MHFFNKNYINYLYILNYQGGKYMQKYICTVCSYVYDPEEGDPDNGVDAGTAFKDIPEDWTCPVCGAEKDEFEPQD